MKKIIKLVGIILVLILLTPVMVVNAKTKTEELVDALKESVKSFNGTVDYEDDIISINWASQNSKYSMMTFTYHDNIIEYDSGEITSYEEAESVTNHTIYALYLIEAALKVNGYTEEEITTYFSSENINFNYETNGFEYATTGPSQEFSSDDESMTTIVAPRRVKIDVSRVNLNQLTDAPIEPKETTVIDVVEYLQADQGFTTIKDYDGKIVYENEINYDDDTITIYNTYYYDDEYYNALFAVEDDVITYQDEEIEDYEGAERAMSHQMFAMQFIMLALKNNGYTTEQIQKYFQTEGNEVNYEVNGIELKEIGEEKKYTSLDGNSSITISPMSIKIDLKRANIAVDNTEYKVLEGDNQTISNTKELTFRFNIDYSKFKEEGKVYIDGKLVDPSNYISKEGSTIITFNTEYVKTLSPNEHNLKITVDDGEVETTFTIINNPQTGDNIIIYISLLGISLIGLIGIGLYTKKEFNK